MNVLFEFPRINGTPFDFVVGPGWTIEIYDGGTPVEVDADAGGTDTHSFPIVVSSTGRIPVFYLDDATQYSIVIRNEKGEVRFNIDPFEFPFVLPVELSAPREIHRIDNASDTLYKESAVSGDIIEYEYLNPPRFVDAAGNVIAANIIPLMPVSTETATGADLSVTGKGFIRVENAAVTSLATFSNPIGGQRLFLRFLNGNTTIEHNTGNIFLSGGANITPAANDTLALIYDSVSNVWVEE